MTLDLTIEDAHELRELVRHHLTRLAKEHDQTDPGAERTSQRSRIDRLRSIERDLTELIEPTRTDLGLPG